MVSLLRLLFIFYMINNITLGINILTPSMPYEIKFEYDMYECNKILNSKYDCKPRDRKTPYAKWIPVKRFSQEEFNRNLNKIMSKRKGCLLKEPLKDSAEMDEPQICFDTLDSIDSINVRTQKYPYPAMFPEINNYALSHGECVKIQNGTRTIERKYWFNKTEIKFVRYCARLTDPIKNRGQYSNKSLDSYGNLVSDPRGTKVKKMCLFKDPDNDIARYSDKDDSLDNVEKIQIYHKGEQDREGIVVNNVVDEMIGCKMVSLQTIPAFVPNRLPSINSPITAIQPCGRDSRINGSYECVSEFNGQKIKNNLINNAIIIGSPIQIDACLNTNTSNCLNFQNLTSYSSNLDWIEECKGNEENKPCLLEKDIKKLQKYLDQLGLQKSSKFRPLYGEIMPGSYICANKGYSRYLQNGAPRELCGVDIGPWTLQYINTNEAAKIINFVSIMGHKNEIKIEIDDTKICARLKDKESQGQDIKYNIIKCIDRSLDDLSYKINLINKNHFSPIIEVTPKIDGNDSSIKPITIKPSSFFIEQEQEQYQNRFEFAGITHEAKVINDNDLNNTINNTRCIFKSTELDNDSNQKKKISDVISQQVETLFSEAKDKIMCGKYNTNQSFDNKFLSSIKEAINQNSLNKAITNTLNKAITNTEPKTESNPIFNTEALYLGGNEVLKNIYYRGGSRVCIYSQINKPKLLLVKCDKNNFECVGTINQNIPNHQTTLFKAIDDTDIEDSDVESMVEKINNFFESEYNSGKPFKQDIFLESLKDGSKKKHEVTIRLNRNFNYNNALNEFSNFIVNIEGYPDEFIFRYQNLLDMDMCSIDKIETIEDYLKNNKLKTTCAKAKKDKLWMEWQEAMLGETKRGSCLHGYAKEISIKDISLDKIIKLLDNDSATCGLKNDIHKTQTEQSKNKYEMNLIYQENKNIKPCQKEILTDASNIIKCKGITNSGKCEKLNYQKNQGEIIITSSEPLVKGSIIELEVDLSDKIIYEVSENIEIGFSNNMFITENKNLINDTISQKTIPIFLKLNKNVPLSTDSKNYLKEQAIKIRFITKQTGSTK